MTRKVRHPYQVLEVAEMVAGQTYTFVQIFRKIFTGTTSSQRSIVSRYVMGGVVLVETLADQNLKVEVLAQLPADPIVTVHMDGWHPISAGLAKAPTLVYWNGVQTPMPVRLSQGWNMLSEYLGPVLSENDEYHCIVVPAKHWDADPHLHVADWDNPDTIVKRLLNINDDADDAINWERRMRAKTHAAMAKAFGF